MKTLDEMNERFRIWLEECYQNRLHSALKEMTPVQAYNADPKPLKYLPADVVANAFLHSESRKVDKSGCISFNSVKYEVGIPYVGRKVDIVFDPQNTDELMVEYQDDTPFAIHKLIIGERVSEKPEIPEFLTLAKPTSSRLLDAAKEQNNIRKDKQKNTVISFRDMKTGGEENV